MQYFFWAIVSVPLLLAAYCATLPFTLPLEGWYLAWRGRAQKSSDSFLPGVATLIVVLGSPVLFKANFVGKLVGKIALAILILDILFWLPLLLFAAWERYFRPCLKHGSE